MTISAIKEILNAELLSGADMIEDTVISACGADLMSDVLAFVKEQGVLLTGLVNPQTVRTAEMMDMKCIVFVRGKNPEKHILELAEGCGIAVLATPMRMYEACGRLYSAGLGVGGPL